MKMNFWLQQGDRIKRIYNGSSMGAHVFLNLLNELGKR